jgi:hypothetical protein
MCTTVLAFLRLWVATCFKVVGSVAATALVFAAARLAGDLAAAVFALTVFATLAAFAAVAVAIWFVVLVAMKNSRLIDETDRLNCSPTVRVSSSHAAQGLTHFFGPI